MFLTEFQALGADVGNGSRPGFRVVSSALSEVPPSNVPTASARPDVITWEHRAADVDSSQFLEFPLPLA